MWVRNQSKKTLTNGVISYIASGDKIFLRNENNSNDNSGYFKLAKYSTEEKALKVLDMIEKWINNFSGTDTVNIPVFRMPQDSEV